MKPRKGTALLCFCLLALLATACTANGLGCWFTLGGSRVSQTAEEDLRQPARGLDSVAVETHNGRITLVGSTDSNEIAVHVVKKARGVNRKDAANCMKAIEVQTSVKGSTMKLGWRWAEKKKRRWQASVDFEVKLPARLVVAATSHNGEIQLSKMASAATLLTHNGRVKVDRLKANLNAKTHNGAIEVKGLRGDIDAETHNGRIAIGCVATNVRAITYNGAVDADLSGSEAINGRIVTHNGSVTVRLGDQASVQIACSTNRGRVKAEREIATTVRKRTVLVGKVGAGEGKLEVNTDNGSITVK